MEELTPEQKLSHEAVQKNVSWLKFVRSHVRWMGIFVQVVGVFAHNTALLILGTFVWLFSYLWAAGIMETITISIWDRSDEKDKKSEEETKE